MIPEHPLPFTSPSPAYPVLQVQVASRAGGGLSVQVAWAWHGLAEQASMSVDDNMK